MTYYTVGNLQKMPVDMTIDAQTRVKSEVGSSYDPNIFGPSMWFTLHNGSTNYPMNPTDYVKCGMKSLVMNLPLIVPCINCREHFYDFVRDANLDEAVSSRYNLFKFFVDLHNYVNVRYGKPRMEMDEAKLMYSLDRPGAGSQVKITYR